MFEIIAGLLLLFGSFFCLIATIGLLRLPDLLTRMHAASKAGSLGAVSLFLSVALSAADISIAARVIIGICFLLLTIPVSSHLLARAAHLSEVYIWPGTYLDDYRKSRSDDGASKKAQVQKAQVDDSHQM